jgi:replicative DNA helicase
MLKVNINNNYDWIWIWDIILDTVDDMFTIKNTTKTWFERLDEYVKINPWNLVIIAWRPWAGKSFFMMNLWLEISKKQPICFLSFEMTEEEITTNIINNKIEWLNWKDKDKVITDLSEGNINIDKMNKFKVYSIPPMLNNIISTIRTEYNKWTEVFFIDYLQLLNGNKQYQNKHTEIWDITWQLKALAQELKIKIIMW